jgi:hypothetical protein
VYRKPIRISVSVNSVLLSGRFHAIRVSMKRKLKKKLKREKLDIFLTVDHD